MADLYDSIRGEEGFNPKAYWDNKQWSIGYGTRASHPGEVIDKPEAERRLNDEVGKAGGYVSKAFPNLAPHQRDALTSFTYNLGPGWIDQPSRLRTAVGSGDWDASARIMQEYNKANGEVSPGLVARRARESALFSGAPSASSPPTGGRMASPYDPQAAPAYAGMSPEEVDWNRRFGGRLAQLGTDTSPVGHWTQALARVVQGGLGGYQVGLANEGERAGRRALAQALTGPGSAQEKMAALFKTGGWGDDLGQKLMAGQLSSQLQHESPQGQLTYNTGTQALGHATVMNPIQEKTAQAGLDTAERNQVIDEQMLADVGFRMPPRAGQQTPTPMPTPSGVPPVGGPSPTQNAGLPAVPGVVLAQATATGPALNSAGPSTPAAPAATESFIKQILSTRSPAEQKAWVLQFRANKEKAVEKLYEWADPLKEQEKERQQKVGAAIGTAQVDLPKVVATSDRLTRQVDAILNQPDPKNPGQYMPDPSNPGQFLPNKTLPGVTGPLQGWLPTLTGKKIDLEERIKQLGGGAFLQAFDSLKGGGQITEVEGAKATAALARLTNLRQSDEGYRASLKEFRDEVVRLTAIAKQRAEAPARAPTTAATPAPTPSTVPVKPPAIPDGSMYSPSRKMWRAPDGRLFDETGTPVKSAT